MGLPKGKKGRCHTKGKVITLKKHQTQKIIKQVEEESDDQVVSNHKVKRANVIIQSIKKTLVASSIFTKRLTM